MADLVVKATLINEISGALKKITDDVEKMGAKSTDSMKKTAKATEKELVVIEDGIKKKIEDAVKFAEESPYPDPSEALKDVYEQKDYPFTTD